MISSDFNFATLWIKVLKKKAKNLLIAFCRRLGDMSPVQISWRDFHDHAYMRPVLETMRLAKFYEPRETALPENQVVAVFAPHPDDEVIGLGGSIMKMREQGCQVHVVHFTLGDAPGVYQESLAVNEMLGLVAHYLRFDVDNIPTHEQALTRVSALLAGIEPTVIFIPFVLDDNEDHRRVNEIFLKLSEQKISGLARSAEVWAYQVYSFFPVNAAVRITSYMDRKIEAMRCYVSQFQVRDWAHFMRGLNAFNIRFVTGYVGEEYVEIFYKDTAENYAKICRSYFGSDPSRCYRNPAYARP